MSKLSVIILSYNTKEITKKCLDSINKSIIKNKQKNLYELIIIDNASTDGSCEMINKWKKNNSLNYQTHTIFNKKNIGYPKANNQGLSKATGKYILFLNSDVEISNVNFENIIEFLDKNSKVGALTVKVVLPSGSIDSASHRGFPTIWNSFCYFSKLEFLFGKLPILGKVVGGYHMTHKDLSIIHDIDSPSGAFYFTRKDIVKDLKGFDDKFFMYGEDLDLSYRMKKRGYRIIYYPIFQVFHLKYASGLKKKNKKIMQKTKKYFYDSMKRFYRKHYERFNIEIINKAIYFFIDLKSKL